MFIALLDYGAGNLTSVRKALGALGAPVRTPESPAALADAAAVIVPGVGHFAATRALDDAWREAIRGTVAAGRPLLGICLGLQWLFEGSDEAPDVRGLGALAGRCRLLTPESRIPDPKSPHQHPESQIPNPESRLKVPHLGWNALQITRDSRLLAGVSTGEQVYFAHSYVAPLTNDTVAQTRHGETFASAVEHEGVFGVQFHPEKSGDVGLRVLTNFLEHVRQSALRPPPSALHPPPSALRPPPSALRPPPSALRPPPSDVLSKRIIACLDVRDGRVVKGVRFEQLRSAGDPADLAARYNREGIDELVILDVTATIEERRALAETVAAVARQVFIPLAVGGGIRTEADAAALIEAGADKVSLNTAALANPALLTTLATRYGSQAVVVAIDAKRDGEGWTVFVRSGREPTGRDAVGWAREAVGRGAGEILLTSIDRDGTRSGFDCALTAAVSNAVSIPVIASGGAGTFDHFVEVFAAGRADAALAASIFHYAEHGVRDLKHHLQRHGIPMRL